MQNPRWHENGDIGIMIRKARHVGSMVTLLLATLTAGSIVCARAGAAESAKPHADSNDPFADKAAAASINSKPDVAWNAPGAGNPFAPGYYADPAIYYENGTFYVYATVDGPAWGATELALLTSGDLREWREHPVNWPNPKTLKGGKCTNVWAPDIVKARNGKYYLYVSINHEVWVGVADKPQGPWKDALDGKPLVARKMDPKVHHIDPACFIDDDGQAYLYWGSGWQWKRGPAYMARLNPDMISFAEKPRQIHPPFFFEGSYMIKRGGVYYYMFSDGRVSEDSYKVRYATSKSPEGPWIEGKNSPILETSADKTVHGPGHHSVLRNGNDYYIVYCRDANPLEGNAYRQLAIDKMEFGPDGSILAVKPTHRSPLAPDDHKNNLAYGKPVTASSSAKGHGPEAAVDGNNGTRWQAEGDASKPAWIQVDLGENAPYCQVSVDPEYALKRYDYKIEASPDGKSWEQLATRPGVPLRPDRGGPWTTEFRKARYVRVTFLPSKDSDAKRFSIWELKASPIPSK
jgi:hypothetical protein